MKLWDFIVGAAGGIFFLAAIIGLGMSLWLREKHLPPEGTTERALYARPVLHGITLVALLLGIAATTLRMGMMT